MAAPTFTAITPNEGHAGGVLVQITGTNFRLIDEPPQEWPVSGPTTARVEVIFSGGPYNLSERATQVAVWSGTELFCMTPPLDPFDAEIAFMANAATDTFTATGHGLANGQVVQLTGAALPGGVDDSTPYYVIDAAANTFRIAPTPGGTAVNLTSNGSGIVLADGAYNITIRNLDDEGEPIQAETVTKARAFRPLRPDLSDGGHLADVLEQFTRELRRQVVKHVSWTTHTEYNEETGTVEIAFPSKLPHVILAGIEMNENRDLGQTAREDENYNDPDIEGDFVTYRRAIFVDIEGSLIGVSDNARELLALVEALKAFFQKNPELRVPREPADQSAGFIRYNLRSSQRTSISTRDDNTNIQWFELPFKIVGVRLEQIPGLPARTVPGVPVVGRPTEAIIERGKTLQVDIGSEPALYDGIDLGALKKS